MSKTEIPSIRFRGFDNTWEQRKFSDLAETRRGLTYNPSNIRDSGIRVLRSSNIAEDQFIYGDEDVFVEPDAVNIPYANQGDILITSANGSTRLVGKHTIIRDIPNNSAVHGGFMLLATAQNSEFVNALMSAPWYAKFISLYVAGGNGAIGNLNKNDLDEQNVFVPKDAEQKVIGQYFCHLDNLITLHQREYEKLMNIKKSMLEKMFPRDGANVPEIRFAGFTDAWEQRKVSEIAPLQRGFDLPTADMEPGMYPVVMSNGIGGYHSKYKVKGPGVVTGRSGTIGKLHYIEDDYWPHNTTLWVTDFKGNNPKYTYYMYQRLNLGRFGSGSGVPTLNRNDVHDALIMVPSFEEQVRISDYFSSFDDLITLHQRKLEKLKNIKNALLEKMFV